MPPEWAKFHARDARTDSRMLPPAAFPSLPLDQPPQIVSNQQSHRASDVEDPTRSDKDEGLSILIDSDEPDVISEVRWKAIKYHVEEDTPTNQPVTRTVLADRQRLINAGALPEVKEPSRRSTRPRSLNYDHLKEKHRQLTNKRKTLETKLRMLGYIDPQLEAAILAAKAKDLPENLATINALWCTVQDLKWLTHKLEMIESRARLVYKAKKKFFGFGRLPERAAPEPKLVFRRGAEDGTLPPVGWVDNSEWQQLHAAKKVLPTTTTSYCDMG